MHSEQFIKMESMELIKNPSSIDILENVPTFLSKTYQILQNHDYNDIISWTRNGEGFIVKKVKQFSEKILPLHFRHNNYSSFVRQLNMYDFHKMRQDNQQNAFKNILFKKGQKHLLRQIQRKDYKKNKDLRLQLNFKQEDVQRKKKNNQQNLLVKELDVQINSSAMFSISHLQTTKSLTELIHSQESILFQLQKYIQGSEDKNIGDIIDMLIELQTLNSKFQLYSSNSSQRCCNFLFSKYLKWNSLIPDEKTKVKGNSNEFPSWANIITSTAFCGSSKLIGDF